MEIEKKIKQKVIKNKSKEKRRKSEIRKIKVI
jgi:hypothetical protein